MATYRLFPSTSGPSSAASYSGPFLAGLQFEVTTGGTWLDGYWWWVCPTGQPTVPQKFALWQIYNTSEGVLVATATVTSGALVPGQWNYVALDTPVPLAVGVTYVASTGLSGGFPITDNQFGPGEQYSAGIIDGPLSAYSDITGSLPSSFGMNQGLFSTAGTDPTVNMPVDGFNSANFWLDVQIDTSGPAGTSYRLWPSFPLIGGQVSIDTGQETTGTEFWLSEPCTLDNLWFYSPPGVTLLPSACQIWDVATQSVVVGTQNSSPAWTGAAGSGWVACPYSGVTLPAGKYKATVYSSGGERFYQENTHYFSSPLTSEEDNVKSFSPTAWWELVDAAGSTTASDSSGNGDAGTVKGGVVFGQSGPLAPGTAAAFDGSTGYVSTPLNTSSKWAALSMVAWVKIPSNNAQVSGALGNTNPVAGGGASLQLVSSGGDMAVQANLATSSGSYEGSFVGTAAWGDGEWHHVGIVWNGTTVTAYLDGAAIGTPANLAGTLTSGSSNIGIGLAGGAYMLGDLAQCAIFNYALSAADMVALYHPAAYPIGAGANGITAGPLSSPSITNAAPCTGNSTGVTMTGNSTYIEGPFAYPVLFDVNDGGENRWIDVEVTPGTGTITPPPGPVNSGAFLVFFP
jgi:Concanavalin A-like lectin/glucanases superfamily/Domain of unknown function (DUF4082)